MTRTARRRPRRPVWELRRDPHLRVLQEFTDLVVVSSRSSVQRERLRRAVGTPVTTASLTALRLIERSGPLALSEVARRLELDQSTLSRQVRPLENEGLVSRTADAGDRRVAWLTVTPQGRRLLQRMRDVALNDYDVALGDWPAADRARLAELVDRFRRDLLRTQVDSSGWSVEKTAGAAGDGQVGSDD